MNTLQKDFIRQIEDALDEYKDFTATESSRESHDSYFYFMSKFETLILRLSNKNNVYYQNCLAAKAITPFNNRESLNYRSRLNAVKGILELLIKDIKSGYINTFEELIHAALFSDFLEMAEHLIEEGYKDPAAVIIGSTLEEHIRKLAQKNSIAIEFTDAKGNLKPKKADALNSELAAANAYSKLDQKSITAWLDLRNKAAHGKYAEYDQKQVEIFLQSVRDFITRNPA